MIQYITHTSEKYSLLEQVTQVIEGGCRWIQLRMKQATDEEVAEAARLITPICQETGTILVIDDRVEVVMQTRVHGVHLGHDDMPPAQAREYLGPHAIIGCTANTADEIIALAELDIDYIGLGPMRHTTTKERLSPTLGLEGYRQIISQVREAGVQIPIVAIGGLTLDDVQPLLQAGANGLAVSSAILTAPDPTAMTAAFIARCS